MTTETPAPPSRERLFGKEAEDFIAAQFAKLDRLEENLRSFRRTRRLMEQMNANAALIAAGDAEEN